MHRRIIMKKDISVDTYGKWTYIFPKIWSLKRHVTLFLPILDPPFLPLTHCRKTFKPFATVMQR